jgi:hypothetical protein
MLEPEAPVGLGSRAPRRYIGSLALGLLRENQAASPIIIDTILRALKEVDLSLGPTPTPNRGSQQ